VTLHVNRNVKLLKRPGGNQSHVASVHRIETWDKIHYGLCKNNELIVF